MSSILASKIVSRVKSEFEGGNALDVDWDVTLEFAMNEVLKKALPHTLVRRKPLYGGLSDADNTFISPTDIFFPTGIYTPLDGKKSFTYLPPSEYDKDQARSNIFTIRHINGQEMIVARAVLATSNIIIDSMDAVGTIAGDVTPTLNQFNFRSGSGAIQATFTDAGDELGDTFDTAIDISGYLDGVLVVPMYLSDKSKISSFEFRLKTDDSNYYALETTSDGIGDALIDGWNDVRFSLSSRSSTGSPVSTNITKWSIVITTTTGNTLEIIIDRVVLQKSDFHYIQYISDLPFIDATTNAWKGDVDHEAGDFIRIDKYLWAILHYEMAILVSQSSSYNQVTSDAVRRFEGQKESAYEEYYQAFPSQVELLSYNISPNLNREFLPMGVGRYQDDTDFEIPS